MEMKLNTSLFSVSREFNYLGTILTGGNNGTPEMKNRIKAENRFFKPLKMS